MTGSKVILVGAISVVFGLYTLSLYRVNGIIGNTAEVSLYLSKAADNSKAGMQRAMDLWARGNDHYQPTSSNFPTSETFNLLEAGPTVMDKFSYTVQISWPSSSFGYNLGGTYTLTIVSHGYYKGPNEPAAFQGHEVIRTAYVRFLNTNYGSDSYPWYQLTLLSVNSTINYTAEKQLENLQGSKQNIIGY